MEDINEEGGLTGTWRNMEPQQLRMSSNHLEGIYYNTISGSERTISLPRNLFETILREAKWIKDGRDSTSTSQ
jgi:hypothetical protein